jgi:hypothetical protein
MKCQTALEFCQSGYERNWKLSFKTQDRIENASHIRVRHEESRELFFSCELSDVHNDMNRRNFSCEPAALQHCQQEFCEVVGCYAPHVPYVVTQENASVIEILDMKRLQNAEE